MKEVPINKSDGETKELKSLLERLFEYSKRGWFIFPVGLDKKPLTPHGFKDATNEINEIEKLWKHKNDAIGVDCGRSGLVVIDLDNKHDNNGLESFERLHINHSQAFHSRTPSGGQHLIFKDTTGGKIRNSASKIAPGVDVRANGGYVILSPSKVNAGEYVALDGWESREPGRLPKRLEDILLANASVRRTLKNIRPFKGNLSKHGEMLVNSYLKYSRPGMRNLVGFWLACKLRDDGINENDAKTFMIEYARRIKQTADDPYTEWEALASLRSAFSSHNRTGQI